MNPLNDKWIESYKKPYKNQFIIVSKIKWLGAWRMMRDFQNTEVCKS